MDEIKIISQKPVFTADLFKILQTEIETKSKKKHTHNIIYKDDVSSVFPIAPDGQLYLISEYRYLFGRNLTQEIAGYVNKGEDPLSAAKRELKEEAGFTATDWSKIATIDLAASSIKGKQHLYIARGLTEGVAQPEEDEYITVVKMPIDEAVQMVLSGKIQTAISALGILLLDKMKQEGKL